MEHTGPMAAEIEKGGLQAPPALLAAAPSLSPESCGGFPDRN